MEGSFKPLSFGTALFFQCQRKFSYLAILFSLFFEEEEEEEKVVETGSCSITWIVWNFYVAAASLTLVSLLKAGITVVQFFHSNDLCCCCCCFKNVLRVKEEKSCPHLHGVTTNYLCG